MTPCRATSLPVFHVTPSRRRPQVMGKAFVRPASPRVRIELSTQDGKKRAFDLDPANSLPNASVRTFAVRLARNVALTVSDEPQENAHPSFVVGSLLLFCGVQQRRLRSGAGGTGGTFFSGFARTQTHRLTLWTVADEDRVYRSRLMTTALAMQNVAY